MDSLTAFSDYSIGAESALTSLITLVAINEALSRGHFGGTTKTVLTAALNGVGFCCLLIIYLCTGIIRLYGQYAYGVRYEE
jgi:hypothetical protein